MHKYIFSIFFVSFLLSVSCKKQNTNTIAGTNTETNGIEEVKEITNQSQDDLKPFQLKRYYGMADVLSPDGMILRVYNNEIKETPWGPIYSPIVCLYNKDDVVLVKYNTIDLIDKDFWPGEIDITYNVERHSFDMLFSADGYGNYGTGYVDLNTNKYIRELIRIEPSEEEKLEKELQNQNLEEREEGATLRQLDPTIFSLGPKNVNN